MRLKNECVHQQLDDHQLTQLEGLSIDQYTSGEGCGIKALELGSGNGFLSVCFLALAQTIPLKELVVTDMADHLTLMAETLKRNSHAWDELRVIKPIDGDDVATSESLYKDTLSSDDATTQQSNVTVTVTEHQWGEFPTITNPNPTIEQRLQNQKYDFIFGSDLAYRNYLHKPLIASLIHFSHEHTVSLIGVTMNDTHPVFFDLLTKAGFRYERLADHLVETEYRGRNFGLFAIQKR
eukprot:g2965.t1 g2965   contig12:1165381-1166273(-)